MLERAARPPEAPPTPPFEASGQPRATKEVRGAPDQWRPWGGGARRAAARPCVSALGALRNHHIKGLSERMFVGVGARRLTHVESAPLAVTMESTKTRGPQQGAAL